MASTHHELLTFLKLNPLTSSLPESVLKDIQVVYDILKKKNQLTRYALINWSKIYFEIEKKNIPLDSCLAKTNRALDKSMSYVYLGLNLFGLAVSISSLLSGQHIHTGIFSKIQDDTLGTVAGSGWNYWDAAGGFAAMLRQFTEGETGMGVANLISSTQLMVLTLLANIAKYHSSALHLSAATITAFTGFSFAACMFFSWGVEVYEIRQCNKRIESLKAAAMLANEEDRPAIEKTLLIEKAQRENHKRAAKAWFSCGVAMTSIAVISFIALSGVTFGALPAAAIITAAVAVLTGIIRTQWVKRKDYTQLLKQSLQTSDNKSLYDQLNDSLKKNPQGINCQSTFFSPKMLKNLLIKNPKQLQTILKKA